MWERQSRKLPPPAGCPWGLCAPACTRSPIVFIVLGVMNGGLRDVLVKAVNICTECIGLG